MIYRATSKDNKLFIAMYETEEPKRENFEHKGRDKTVSFNIAIIDWQSSGREYEVRDEYKWEVINELTKHWIQSSSSMSFHKELQKGIDCTFLKDRLKLEKQPVKRPKTGMFVNHNTYEEVWTLLPLEDKKENEVDLWDEIYKSCPFPLAPYKKWAEEIKSKYTITRKPTIQEPK